MAQDLEPSAPVDYCCIKCCKAADFGTHDYCLPCETNPACSSSYQTKDDPPPKGGNSQDKTRRN